MFVPVVTLMTLPFTYTVPIRWQGSRRRLPSQTLDMVALALLADNMERSISDFGALTIDDFHKVFIQIPDLGDIYTAEYLRKSFNKGGRGPMLVQQLLDTHKSALAVHDSLQNLLKIWRDMNGGTSSRDSFARPLPNKRRLHFDDVFIGSCHGRRRCFHDGVIGNKKDGHMCHMRSDPRIHESHYSIVACHLKNAQQRQALLTHLALLFLKNGGNLMIH
jgi:hypothetical protein